MASFALFVFLLTDHRLCFVCVDCGKKIESLTSVTSHKKNENHNTYNKQYGDILFRIGNFHLELTMHRAYVSLNWPITYSEIAMFVNFKSPKAQLVVQKVADFHKGSHHKDGQTLEKVQTSTDPSPPLLHLTGFPVK